MTTTLLKEDREDQDQLLRADDIAQIFNVSTPRAYSIMASGQVPVVRIGRAVRVSRKQLEKWIEEQSKRSLVA